MLCLFRMLRVCRWTGARKDSRQAGGVGEARPTLWGLSDKSEPEAHFWDGPRVFEQSLEPGFLTAQAHVSQLVGSGGKRGIRPHLRTFLSLAGTHRSVCLGLVGVRGSGGVSGETW